MEKQNNRSVGAKYEDIATNYLIENGYRIVKRNYTNKHGEIDIIAQKDNLLIFIEVKYRKNNMYGDPLEAVDIKKQIRISKTALYYYTYNGYKENKPIRFDVIAFYGDGSIKHIKNAFNYNEK